MEDLHVNFLGWLTWVSLAIGLTVGWLVYRYSSFLVPRKFRTGPWSEEELPWETLLEMMQTRHREQDGRGSIDDLPAEELLRMLMSQIPSGATQGENPGAEEFGLIEPGLERRASRRRWLNPIEVRITSPFHEKPLSGLVINRSTGGLALLTDAELKPDAVLFVRPTEAPATLPSIEVIVRHGRAVGRLCLIGCQYKNELPWNVKVWFG